jgi:transposase-like protein
MANRRRDSEKEQFWRRMVAQQRQSGGTIRAFCQREGLSQPSFYQWRRELARRDRAPIARRGAATFVPIQVVAEAALIEIALPGGVVVRVRAGADAATLRQVLATLVEGRPC